MGSEISEIGWTQDLETGIDVLDGQHHRYMELLANFLDKASRTSSTTGEILDLAETFNFLRQYAREHFSTEELVMKESGYTDFKSHHQEHLYFLKHVEDLYSQMKTSGFSSSVGREVNYYIIEWFVEHIRFTDKKLAVFLKEKAAEG